MGGSGAPINQTEKQRIQKEVTDRGNGTESDTITEQLFAYIFTFTITFV